MAGLAGLLRAYQGVTLDRCMLEWADNLLQARVANEAKRVCGLGPALEGSFEFLAADSKRVVYRTATTWAADQFRLMLTEQRATAAGCPWEPHAAEDVQHGPNRVTVRVHAPHAQWVCPCGQRGPHDVTLDVDRGTTVRQLVRQHAGASTFAAFGDGRLLEADMPVQKVPHGTVELGGSPLVLGCFGDGAKLISVVDPDHTLDVQQDGTDTTVTYTFSRTLEFSLTGFLAAWLRRFAHHKMAKDVVRRLCAQQHKWSRSGGLETDGVRLGVARTLQLPHGHAEVEPWAGYRRSRVQLRAKADRFPSLVLEDVQFGGSALEWVGDRANEMRVFFAVAVSVPDASAMLAMDKTSLSDSAQRDLEQAMHATESVERLLDRDTFVLDADLRSQVRMMPAKRARISRKTVAMQLLEPATDKQDVLRAVHANWKTLLSPRDVAAAFEHAQTLVGKRCLHDFVWAGAGKRYWVPRGAVLVATCREDVADWSSVLVLRTSPCSDEPTFKETTHTAVVVGRQLYIAQARAPVDFSGFFARMLENVGPSPDVRCYCSCGSGERGRFNLFDVTSRYVSGPPQ